MPLKYDDYEEAAALLGCEPAAVAAVASVESAGKGFLPDGRPKILYERHLFHKLTNGTYSLPENAGFSSTRRGGYGGGAKEYDRLEKACCCNSTAANQSCSWGAFQILGTHWKRLGFTSVDEFVDAMKKDEASHLRCFVQFIKTDPALLAAIRARDWAKFARIYNGPAYKENQYDVKMANAYAKFKREPEPAD